MVEKYYESCIKRDVLNALRKRKIINSQSIIASEYVLGSTGHRADLVVYNGSKLIGIEIKSKHDSLGRLKSQIEAYTACFDEVFLVSDEKHLKSANDIVPPEVHIFNITQLGSMVIWREAVTPVTKVKSVCLKLLGINKLKKMMGVPLGVPIKKTVLLAAANELRDEIIFETVTASFVQTFSETSEKFWEHVGRKQISCENMQHLSRFAIERNNATLKKAKQHLFWESWRNQVKETLQAGGA